MIKNHVSYTILPLPRERQVIIDGGRIAARRHTVSALIEVDVTQPRRFVHGHKVHTGETLSFTAFVIGCLGKAIDENKMMHAYRDWRNRLIVVDGAPAACFVARLKELIESGYGLDDEAVAPAASTA